MAAHVFVVPGTLDALHCDDVIVSTDQKGPAGVREQWWPVLGWDGSSAPEERERVVRLSGARRYVQLDPRGREGGGPARWLLHVGALPGQGVEWLQEGVRQVLRAVADTAPTATGSPRRVALPVVGVGGGGLGRQRGAVIAALLAELERAPDSLDVVLVASSRADYAALQARRLARGMGRLDDECLEGTAAALAGRARAGQLAVFMGAGTGVAAGLPTWWGLLDALAARLDVPGGAEALSRLSPLDAAEVLRRSAHAVATSGGSRVPGGTLGHHVAAVLGTPQRYALAHVLLAALGAEQVVTTNFDDLYEKAVQAVTGSDVPVVLPDREPEDDLRRGRGWLLKLHGDARRPESIVLDRRSFVRYDATQRPLASVLQATLLTKHLLVVGASMTDDNVIRLVHEVATLNEDHDRSRTMGTLVTLERQELTAKLWAPEFTTVSLGPPGPAGESRDEAAVRIANAGRSLEILLDRVAALAAQDSVHHLLDRRYADLFAAGADEERAVAEQLAGAAERIREFLPTSERGAGWERVLAQLESWGARRR
ncbi:SIR2 family NAD-dependent protein deacylase [Geodermatophilus sp. SYSU D00758]